MLFNGPTMPDYPELPEELSNGVVEWSLEGIAEGSPEMTPQKNAFSPSRGSMHLNHSHYTVLGPQWKMQGSKIQGMEAGVALNTINSSDCLG